MDSAPRENELNWRFSQCFGDKGDIEEVSDADIISAVEFDHTGDFFATGDRGGRIVLFERNEGKICEYRFFTEFQSHELEFDCLKSLEIEEKIVKIKWLHRRNPSHFLLATNDKTIKLWKISQKESKVVSECNVLDNLSLPSTGYQKVPPALSVRNPKTKEELKFPSLIHHDNVISAVPRRTYANAHTYHINSISCNNDGETFLSSDDLRVNLWNLDISDQCFNIIDIKPVNMEDLTEVITSAEFSPVDCNTFIYSISKGAIRLIDMRDSALCDKHSKVFVEPENPAAKTFFTEIIASISDIKFSPDGRFILSRDYMTMKLWDVRMENRPLKSIQVHNHLQSKLCDLYETDILFDRFDVNFSGDGRFGMTGSYGNFFQIHSLGNEETPPLHLQADKHAFRTKKPFSGRGKGLSAARKPATEFVSSDFNNKITQASWHPKENTIAIAATINLFVFSTC